LKSLVSPNLALVILVQAVFCAGNCLWVHYARWIGHLGGDEFIVGLVTGLGPVIGLLFRPTLGSFVDTIGARQGIILGAGISALAGGGNVFVTELGPLVYLSRMGSFVGGALFFGSAVTYVSQTSADLHRTMSIGLMGCGGFLGVALGPLVGDEIFGAGPPDRQRFNMLFLFLFWTGVAALGLSLAKNRGLSLDHGRKRLTTADFLRNCAAHWPGAILAVALAVGVGMTLPFVFLTRFAATVGIHSTGSYFLFYGLFAIALRLAIGSPDTWGKERVLHVGLAMMAAGAWLLLLVTPERYPLFLISALLSGGGHALVFHVMMSLGMESFPLRLHGTAAALCYMGVDFGMIVFSPLIGWMITLVGYQALFLTVGWLAAGSSVFYGCCRALRRRRLRAGVIPEGQPPRSMADAETPSGFAGKLEEAARPRGVTAA
jgi:MFS family permease